MYIDTFDLDDDAAAVDVGRDGDSKEEDPGFKQLARWSEMEDGGEFLVRKRRQYIPSRYLGTEHSYYGVRASNTAIRIKMQLTSNFSPISCSSNVLR